MSRDYDEKRDFIRVSVESELHYKSDYDDGEQLGQLQNLSGRGMMFIASHPISKESIIDIRIDPVSKITPSLNAKVRVVRVMKQRHGDGYEIGAVIQLDEDDELLGADDDLLD